MLPDFINKKYDGRKFKLVCDDLGLANLMVKSKDDLTIVGVVDLEWVLYWARPAVRLGAMVAAARQAYQ